MKESPSGGWLLGSSDPCFLVTDPLLNGRDVAETHTSLVWRGTVQS